VEGRLTGEERTWKRITNLSEAANYEITPAGQKKAKEKRRRV